MVSFYSIPYIIGGLISLALGWFVFWKNRASSTNRMFFFLCSIFSIWLLSYAIAYSTKSEAVAKTCAATTCTAVIFVGTFLYHLVVNFLDQKKQERFILYFVYLVTFVLGYFFITTQYFLNGVYKYYWGYFSKAGILHPYYMMFQALVLLRADYILFKTLLSQKAQLSPTKQAQIKYFLVASLLLLPGMIDYIPKYGVEIYPFGFVFILAFLSVIGYAIVRYKLMDIEVIIKKTLVFAGLLASVFAMLILPTLIIQEYLFRGTGTGGRMAGLAISGIVIILTMHRIEAFLINVTDKYLFQKKYDYKELLKTFTAEVLTVLELDNLVNLTVDKLSDIVKLTSSAVLLFDEEKQQFNVMASRGVKDPTVTLIRPDGIVTFMEETHGYILIKELNDKKIMVPESVKEIIARLSAELIIPMVLHEEVMGMLSLGKKKSDEDYTQDDLDILLPLAKTLSIAISNAKLFDELGKTQAEAAQNEKMAVIGTLSAGINHEICNPLGIARGQCEAFLLNLKDGLYKTKSAEELLERSKEIMAKVIKETDRATAITKKLSGFAKPSKGESELVDISKELDEVQGLVGYELKLEKIEFVKDIEKDLPNIFVDKKQLQEVLFNLVRNAGQAIGEKGRITVSVRQKDRKVFIDIQDTGSGIPEDKVHQLFNPFFTTKEPGKGTGLGLFIVRQVVERSGGRIYLKQTKVGEGTTFTLEFPIASEEPVTQP